MIFASFSMSLALTRFRGRPVARRCRPVARRGVRVVALAAGLRSGMGFLLHAGAFVELVLICFQ